MKVLKLNRSYEPIEVISWQKAIKLVIKEKAEVLKEYEKLLATNIKMPAVIRLLNQFKRQRKRVKFNRRNVIARDRFRCQYCGKKFPAGELTLDHIIPRAQGGITSWNNIVSSCKECNLKKGDKTPTQANMKLKKHPSCPDWMPVAIISLSRSQIPDIWKEFCFWLD